jgi:hypothetical protein
MSRMASSFPREVPPSFEHSLDGEAVKRIMQKTEANKPIEWQLRANDLKIDLIWCYLRYRSRVQFRSSKLAGGRRRNLLKIAKAADDFAELLEGSSSDWWSRNLIAGARLVQENGISIGKIVSAVRTVGKIASTAADPQSRDYAIVLRKGNNSPFEETVASELVQTFALHTGKRATVSRPSTGGEANSPFIRFVVAVFNEFGESYKPETVARAFTRLGKSRRARR